MSQNFQIPQISQSPKSNLPKPAKLSDLLLLLAPLIIFTNYSHAEFWGYCRMHLVCFTFNKDHTSSVLSLRTVAFFSLTLLEGGVRIQLLAVASSIASGGSLCALALIKS